jgi:hypothetical protein
VTVAGWAREPDRAKAAAEVLSEYFPQFLGATARGYALPPVCAKRKHLTVGLIGKGEADEIVAHAWVSPEAASASLPGPIATAWAAVLLEALKAKMASRAAPVSTRYPDVSRLGGSCRRYELDFEGGCHLLHYDHDVYVRTTEGEDGGGNLWAVATTGADLGTRLERGRADHA